MASSLGEDADQPRSAVNLPVEAFDQVGGVQLGPMLRRERHAGEHVGLGLAEEAGKPCQLGGGPGRQPCAIGSRRRSTVPGALYGDESGARSREISTRERTVIRCSHVPGEAARLAGCRVRR